MRRPRLAFLALLLCAGAAATAGCGSSAQSPAPARAAEGRFDVNRAFTLVRRQLAYGQRPAGSDRLRRLAEELRPLLPRGRFERVPGEPRLRNVVGTIRGRRPGIVVGAHYDTLAKPRGFLGANNGAAGTAVVIEVARALRRSRRPPGSREVKFIDDHTPFLRAKVPAVDLIDWTYDGHDLSDRLDKLSRHSLDAVGETVVEAVQTMR